MRNSIFKFLGLIAALGILFTSCGESSDPAEVIEITHYRHSDTPEPPVFVGSEGVDLVTEADLLLHVAERWAQGASIAIAAAFTSHDTWLQICNQDGKPVEHQWESDRIIKADIAINAYNADCSGSGFDDEGWLGFQIHFGDTAYSDGTANTSNCRQLPGAGTKTSGEHSTVSNGSDDDIVQNLKHGVEESKSSETSLDETFDTTAGQTVEAGASFPGGDAKVTATFEEHFGLAKGSLSAQSSTTTREVELEVHIKPDQVLAVAYTLDDSSTQCDRNIKSVADWSGVDIYIYRHPCGPSCDDSGSALLESHDVISSHGRTVHIQLDTADDLVRLLSGADPRCDGCHFNKSTTHDGYIGAANVSHAFSRLDDAKGNRSVEFNGTETTVTKDSASYIVTDVTGYDQDCVADKLTQEGVPVDDSLLDDCRV